MQEGVDTNLKCGVVSASVDCQTDNANVNYDDGLVEKQCDFAQILTPGV